MPKISFCIISIPETKYFQVWPTHAVSAGWLHVLFPVTVFAEKSKYTMARQDKSTLQHR